MMFECPRCGYRDLSCWKAHRHFLYAVYCRVDELEAFKPDLVAALKERKDLNEGPYRYHLTRSGYVIRVHGSLKEFMYKRGLVERAKVFQDPHQQKLSTEPQPEGKRVKK